MCYEFFFCHVGKVRDKNGCIHGTPKYGMNRALLIRVKCTFSRLEAESRLFLFTKNLSRFFQGLSMVGSHFNMDGHERDAPIYVFGANILV
jgi:hypothetical protein